MSHKPALPSAAHIDASLTCLRQLLAAINAAIQALETLAAAREEAARRNVLTMPAPATIPARSRKRRPPPLREIT